MVLTLLMFITLRSSFLVWTSFFFSAFVLFSITIYHLYYEKNYSPFLSAYIVFTFLFFLAAPISQVNTFFEVETPKFVNYFPYRENLVIYANTLISLFNIVFIVAYVQLKKYFFLNKFKKKAIRSQRLLPLTIFILLILSVFFFFLSYNFLQEELSRPNWVKSITPVSLLLIWKKFIFFIPFAGIALCFQYFNKTNKIKANVINIIVFLFFFLILLFWFKNPLTEKRNALGPIYISLIYLFIPKLLNSNIKTVSFLFFSMIIVFPLTAILTHSDATLMEMYRNPLMLLEQMKDGGIAGAFNSLHYDAFANINASIDYVSKYGFSYGYQFLGGFLFFVPRSIWALKPISSGQMIGEHLVSDFGFGFTNLSNSLVSESFLNFGVLGVIIVPIILAYVFIRMISWLDSDNYLKKIMGFYFAIHLIFFLRGDFTNGFSYYIGPLIAVLVIPKFIELITKELLNLKRK